MRKGSVVAVALVGGVALACSACGGGSPSASRTSHRSHHKTHTSRPTTTTAPPTSSSTPTSTTSAAPGTTRCTFADLSISHGQGGAGLGHEGGPLLFKNTGSSTCTLSGYPGVAALNATGQQVSQAQRSPNGYLGGMETGSTAPPVVTLAPGATASALVEGTDVPEGTASSCPTYPALLVTPPTSTHSQRVTLPLPGCSPLQIHPVVPGTTGSALPPSS
ncbi:MAG TPA: DUF4232 domain-containing protein [Acidimicrobiales bacterium]|nr:DUF4232 domain-containing protein [Acidimicrobiales bacterium]